MDITDELTGAAKRQQFLALAGQHCAAAAQDGADGAIILLDIDDFKRINNRHGHATGDAVLRAVVGRCEQHGGEQDVLARYGGEEFAALLPDATLVRAGACAERLRRALAEMPIDVEGVRLPVTLSAGVTVWSHTMRTGCALLSTADAGSTKPATRQERRCSKRGPQRSGATAAPER